MRKMSISYINKQLTRTEFLEKSFNKGKSKDYQNFTNSVLKDLDRFVDHTYHKTIEEIMTDLKADMDKTNDPSYALKFLQDYIDWLEVDHPDILITWNVNQKKPRPLKKKSPLAIHNYVSRVKKFLKMCGGIRIDDSDYTDYLTFPADDSDEERSEPLLKSELLLILDNIIDPRRKTMVYFMKDTSVRIIEAMRIKKKYIDLNTNPITVNLPKSILKNKKRKRTAYLTKETEPKIRQLLKNLEDEDLVFTDNENSTLARDNEEHVWRRLVVKCGFTEKYSNGRLKKNIHSIRAFCITALKEATKDPDYAHGYGGHERYLQQYVRLTPERQIELFKESEPYLTLSETIKVSDLSKENKELREQLALLQNIKQQVKELNQPLIQELMKNSN